MKREIKNDGVYLEIDADHLLARIDEVNGAEILVITKGRVELAGDEKKEFVKSFLQWDEFMKESSGGYHQLDLKQKADVLLRTMLAPPSPKAEI